MTDLLWFGFNLDTPMNEIGWTYIVLGALLVSLGYLIRMLHDL